MFYEILIFRHQFHVPSHNVEELIPVSETRFGEDVRGDSSNDFDKNGDEPEKTCLHSMWTKHVGGLVKRLK